MIEFICFKNFNKLKHCKHAFMSRLLYAMLIIYIAIINIHSQSNDSLKTAAIKQKIKELNEKLARLEAARNPEQEYASACELYEKNKQQDSLTILDHLSRYQRCIADLSIHFNDCAKYLYTVAHLCFERGRNDYIFKKEEIGFKKRMFKKDSTVVIPPEPTYNFTKTFYYYNILFKKHPNFEHINRAYLDLFRIAQLLEDDSLQNVYRDIIINKFPEDAKRLCILPPIIPDDRGRCIQDSPGMDLVRKADRLLRAGDIRNAEKNYMKFIEQYQPDTSRHRLLIRIYVKEQILKINKIEKKNKSK